MFHCCGVSRYENGITSLTHSNTLVGERHSPTLNIAAGKYAIPSCLSHILGRCHQSLLILRLPFPHIHVIGVEVDLALVPLIEFEALGFVNANISTEVYLRFNSAFQYPAYDALASPYDPTEGTSFIHKGSCDVPHYLRYSVIGGLRYAPFCFFPNALADYGSLKLDWSIDVVHVQGDCSWNKHRSVNCRL
jgi:hypothetical protein